MATSERLIIKDVILVSMDDRIGNHRHASILIDDGRIAAIGRDIEADVDYILLHRRLQFCIVV